MKKYFIIIIFLNNLFSQFILIPMDYSQTDHLKAYGITYKQIDGEKKIEWFLNYKGGSFLMPYLESIENECLIKDVYFEKISSDDYLNIRSQIEENNMEVIPLEKAPKIAVYTPDSKQPWDDAVTMVLTYAEVDYDKIYDTDILNGSLIKYDWLHLHHEDFTGQYGKFYSSYRNAEWYIKQQIDLENLAKLNGFNKVSKLKAAVTNTIKSFIENGGFLFAMCSATDALDISLAAHDLDIVEEPFDGDGLQNNFEELLDYTRTFAFENFNLVTNPFVYEYSNIDTPPSNKPRVTDAETDYFTLFEFSAKYDPVPTMLTQNHSNAIRGFMGQTTMFDRSTIKSHVTILGEIEDSHQVKYIYGQKKKGFFAFYGGHDPEDYTHQVGDPPTDLSLHRNSPGYRLILNNILFPAAKKKKLKT